MNKRWEYFVHGTKQHALSDVLEHLGRQGWELVCIHENKAVFKREKTTIKKRKADLKGER